MPDSARVFWADSSLGDARYALYMTIAWNRTRVADRPNIDDFHQRKGARWN